MQQLEVLRTPCLFLECTDGQALSGGPCVCNLFSLCTTQVIRRADGPVNDHADVLSRV